MRIDKRKKKIILTKTDNDTRIVLQHPSGEKMALKIKFTDKVVGVIAFKNTYPNEGLDELSVYVDTRVVGSGDEVAVWKDV